MKPVNLSDSESVFEWITTVHEKHFVELKKSSNLPKDFWPTYSAFSNTEGGFIILGVEECQPLNKINGVSNVDHILVDLWNLISNPQKVSYRTINNPDVFTYAFDDGDVIVIRVHEAPDAVKPVFLNGKAENSYIRTGEGDRKITEEELKAFLRNANPVQDTLPADNFGLDDIDTDSLLSFKERVHKRYPKQDFLKMTNQQFLTEIGAAYEDRDSGEWKLKKGAVLFLGKTNSIRELFPHYHLDYFNRRGSNARWLDRVTDDEPGEYEMNIYNFYRIVYEKLRLLLQESFSLDSEQMRIPITDFDETLRECLVNCLAHADYVQGYPSVKVEAYDGWFSFLNPGKLLVSPQQFKTGGDSRPRNEIVMKFFRLLGASERQGFGGPLIFNSALQNQYRCPEIESDIEHTSLRVWNIDLPDSYPSLSVTEKNTLRVIMKSGLPLSIKGICALTGENDYQTRKAITTLIQMSLVEKMGNGPSTKYYLARTSLEYLAQIQLAVEDWKKAIQKS